MPDDYDDYTKRQETPFGGPNDDTDNYEIATDYAPTVGADQAEAEGSFDNAPPGEHRFVIRRVNLGDKPDPIKVMMPNGTEALYASMSARVDFGIEGHENKTASDFFYLPPADPSQTEAYQKGLRWGQDGNLLSESQRGHDAKKFVHFINRLGFNWPPGGKFPADAKKLGNWKVLPDGRKRVIIATSNINSRVAKTGKGAGQKRDYAGIKWFSYRLADSTATGGGGPPTNGSTTAPVAPQPATAPVAVPVGLDDI